MVCRGSQTWLHLRISSILSYDQPAAFSLSLCIHIAVPHSLWTPLTAGKCFGVTCSNTSRSPITRCCVYTGSFLFYVAENCTDCEPVKIFMDFRGSIYVEHRSLLKLLKYWHLHRPTNPTISYVRVYSSYCIYNYQCKIPKSLKRLLMMTLANSQN